MLGTRFRVERQPLVSETVVYLDTFDWRLYRNSVVLQKTADTCTLLNLSDDSPLLSAPRPAKRAWKFWWELPASRLQERLKALTGVRALLEMARCRTQTRIHHILNRDNKIVVKLISQKVSVSRSANKAAKVRHFVKLLPLKGYDAEARAVAQRLQQNNALQKKEQPYRRVFTAAGRTPGDYSNKMSVSLAPQWQAEKALTHILQHLREIMLKNEDGILRDLDSEFLHDFRVAIRRTRSALSQLKKVFPEVSVQKYKNAFAALAKSTNELRDLDVYLLRQREYINVLPPELQSGLIPIFEYLTKKRRQEFLKVKRKLRSVAYRTLIEEWQMFLSNPGGTGPRPANAGVPVAQVARGTIRKRYDKVLALGRKIGADSPQSAFHELRIECKKLRYLLEFFQSLFSQKDMFFLIKQLKKIQDNLGDFNDLSVQRLKLTTLREEVFAHHPQALAISSAIGGLTAVMHSKQQQRRREFSSLFADFSGPETLERLRRLFQTENSQ